MQPKTIELLAGSRLLTLTGAHETYLDGVAAARQWGDTPLMRLIKKLPVGATYLDIGANIGLTTITAAALRPDIQITAFEPVPSNADFLDQNIRANGITNCRVVRSAVGHATGDVTMTDNGPWSTVDPSFGGAIEAPVTTLDDYCADHLHDVEINLIKIDVEGYEPQALVGARLTITQWKPPIFMEFNSWTLTLVGHNPVAFACEIWEAFEVQSDGGVSLTSPVGLAHDNMVQHGCVEDVILRLRSASALLAIATPSPRGFVIQRQTEIECMALRAEIQALQRSTSWRLTAPLRAAMRLVRG